MSENKNCLSNIVSKLCDSSDCCSTSAPLPRRGKIHQIISDLQTVLFPGYWGMSDLTKENMKFHVGATLHDTEPLLKDQIQRGLRFGDSEKDVNEITDTFLSCLPTVQKLLLADVDAAYNGDPALINKDEAIFCYPCILALTHHRLAHELYKLDVPLLPRIIAEQAHSITGIDIHPGAQIGESFFIDHGTGVVIGETSVIGNNVRIYQGVTLGAKSFPLDENGNPVKGIRRHPLIEDNVIVYAGATILGLVTIGKGSTIGGNVWLTKSVSPNSRIMQVASRQEAYSNGSGI
jgi:serine O-acetyltransferase